MGSMSYAVATAWAVAAACSFQPLVKGGKCEFVSKNDLDGEFGPHFADNDFEFTGGAELLATEHSLLPVHRAALFALAFTPGAYPSELAKTCGVSPMEMVDIINELIEWGFVARAGEEPAA